MPDKSLLFAAEPNWDVCRLGKHWHIPAAARSWLFEPGSITRRLRGAFGGQVVVRVLRQRWDVPFPGEARLLRCAYRRRCLVREVLLQADGEPLVLARTVIPRGTLRGAHRNLAHIGSRPLGEVIFADPDLQRWDMQITAIPPGAWLSSPATPTTLVWGRRTVYALRGRQLLVSEFFLPGALASSTQ